MRIEEIVDEPDEYAPTSAAAAVVATPSQHVDDDDDDAKERLQRLRQLYARGGGPQAMARAQAAGEAERVVLVNALLSSSGTRPMVCTVAPTKPRLDTMNKARNTENESSTQDDDKNSSEEQEKSIIDPPSIASVEDPFDPYPLGTHAELADEELDLLLAALQLQPNSKVENAPIEDTPTNSNNDDDDEDDLLAMMDLLNLDDDAMMMALMEELWDAQQIARDKQECIPCEAAPTRKYLWE